MKHSVTVVSLLAGIASAMQCKNLTIPINVSAWNGVFDISAPVSNIDVTNFILDLTQQGVNYTQEILTGVCVARKPQG